VSFIVLIVKPVASALIWHQAELLEPPPKEMISSIFIPKVSVASI
jgi:hypothetical protein